MPFRKKNAWGVQHYMNFDVHSLDEVSSTNDIVKCAISNGEREGFVAWANSQSGGYGRRGNKWTSPVGGMYASFLLQPEKPDSEIATLGMIAALGVSEALAKFTEEAFSKRIKIKWPNDVVVENEGACGENTQVQFNKICGISTEKVSSCVCIGVGVNVFKPAQKPNASAEKELSTKNRPVYLEDLVRADINLTVKGVLDAFMASFGELYDEWKKFPFSNFSERINAHSILNGKHTDVIMCSSSSSAKSAYTINGKVLRIAEDGALVLLRDDSNESVCIYEGTVVLS